MAEEEAQKVKSILPALAYSPSSALHTGLGTWHCHRLQQLTNPIGMAWSIPVWAYEGSGAVRLVLPHCLEGVIWPADLTPLR